MTLRYHSDRELLTDVERLVGSHREVTAQLVAHLAEIEDRRLHLLAGFSSMFEFCVQTLHLSEGEAFRRILAARLSRRFPFVIDLLASGAVHLSALELLREHLTEGNHAELFQVVSGKSKREVEALLAARFPKADVPSRITRARIEPLSETRFRVEFTASAALREKLERCRDLMSHANPSRDLEVVIGRAVDLLLTELEKKRLGRTKRAHSRTSARKASTRGREANPGAPTTKVQHVSRIVRREVHERDGSQCTYVALDGRRCDARAFLELDHAEPRALGGDNDAGNLRVRCRAHNQLAAEQVFGREHVEQRRRFRRTSGACTTELLLAKASGS